MSSTSKEGSVKRKSEETSSGSSNNKISKKRKEASSAGAGGSEKSKKKTSNSLELSNYEPLSLKEIQSSINNAAKRVPDVPVDGIDPTNKEEVKEWATQMKIALEEFNLLLMCVSPATYKWGSDRSGAADQNLTMLSNELSSAQEQIASSVMPRLTNVLSPMVEMVIKQSTTTATTQEDGTTKTKVKVNTLAQEESDPAFVDLCRNILCRNATMLRQVVLSNFNKVSACIEDYLKATHKDANHDRRGFSY